MEFHHVSVLLRECIEQLNIDTDGCYVDGTMGGGGHSLEIVKRLKGGRLIGVDQDPNAQKAAGERLRNYQDRVTFVRDNFGNIARILDGLGIEKIDGMLLDIGVSSHQLDEGERGFSYQQDAPLDMRMNPDKPFSAYDVINGYNEEELNRVIFTYGEERWAKRIAQFIVKERQDSPLNRRAGWWRSSKRLCRRARGRMDRIRLSARFRRYGLRSTGNWTYCSRR